MEAVQSPCIKICRLNADEICVGCGRTASEISQWLAASAARQVAICRIANARLKDLTTSQRMV